MSAPPREAARWITAAATAVLVYLLTSWLRRIEASLHLDWIVFQDSAYLVRAGRLDALYPGTTPGLPFLYPPPFLPWIVALGFVGRAAGYALIVLATLAATAASLRLLARSLAANGAFACAAVVALSSASWHKTLQLGQVSAFFLLALLASLRAWQIGRETLAGALLAATMLKPSLGLVFPALLLAARRWKALCGFAAGTSVLIASALPFGAEPWRGYFDLLRALPTFVQEEVPAWKQETLYAFWQSVLPDARAPARILWIASALPLAGLAALAWTRAAFEPRSLPRTFGIAVLALVACTPYLYLYDGWLLVLPASAWLFDRASWRSARLHRTAGTAIVAVYVAQHAAAWFQLEWAIAGPATAVWLFADAYDRLQPVSKLPQGD